MEEVYVCAFTRPGGCVTKQFLKVTTQTLVGREKYGQAVSRIRQQGYQAHAEISPRGAV